MSQIRLRPAVFDGLLNIAGSLLSAAGKSASYFIGPALLSPKHFGVYAYLSWLAAVASQIGSTGLVQSAQRFSCQAGSKYSSFASFLLTMGALATTLTATVFLVANKSVATSPLFVAVSMACAVATSIATIQQALLQARRDFVRPLQVESASQFFRMLGLCGLKLLTSISAFSLICMDTVASMLKALLMARRIRENPALLEPKKAITNTEILGYAASLMAISILDVLLWQRGEMFFLSRYATVSAAAHFAVSAQFAQVLIIAPTAALSALLPRLSERAYSGSGSLESAAGTLMSIAVILVVPLYSASVLGGPLLLKIWKPEYAAVGTIMPIVMIGKVALVLSAPLSLCLYASGKQRTILAVVSISGCLALVTDYVLIRKFGLNGAACASAINQTFTATATLVAARKHMQLRISLRPSTTFGLFALLGIEIGLAFTPMHLVASVVCPLLGVVFIFRDPFIGRNLTSLIGWPRSGRLLETNA